MKNRSAGQAALEAVPGPPPSLWPASSSECGSGRQQGPQSVLDLDLTRAGAGHQAPRIAPIAVSTTVAFYREAFGASELFRNVLPDGTILLVELALGPARLLISEETPSLNAFAPPTVGGTPGLLHLEVDDPDAVVRRAVWGGAEVEMEVQEMFWGERYGVVRDPFGHRWSVATAREQLTPDEMIELTPPSV